MKPPKIWIKCNLKNWTCIKKDNSITKGVPVDLMIATGLAMGGGGGGGSIEPVV